MLWNNLLCSLGKSYIMGTFCTARGPRWVWPGWTHKRYGGNENEAFTNIPEILYRPEMKTEKNKTSRLFLPFGEEWSFFDWLIWFRFPKLAWLVRDFVILEVWRHYSLQIIPPNWALNVLWAPEQSTQMSDRLPDSPAQPQTFISLARRATM